MNLRNPPLVPMSHALPPEGCATVTEFIAVLERASKQGKVDITEALRQWRIYKHGYHYKQGRKGRTL
jgi:hypothetical protein